MIASQLPVVAFVRRGGQRVAGSGCLLRLRRRCQRSVSWLGILLVSWGPAQRSAKSKRPAKTNPRQWPLRTLRSRSKRRELVSRLKRGPAAVSDHSPSEAADVGFVQLPYAEDLRPEETTEIMRVQLPRDSLAVLGLPG